MWWPSLCLHSFKMLASMSQTRCDAAPARPSRQPKRSKDMAKDAAKSNQGFLDFGFVGDSPKEDRGFWNFHHALKARTMRASVPTQLIWERSLTVGAVAPLNVCLCHRQPLFFMRCTAAVYQGVK